MSKLEIKNLVTRNTNRGDFPQLTKIYNYYVANTYVTFDPMPSTLEERTKILEQYSNTGPYRLLVAELDGEMIGSANSTQYRTHVAFNETVEFGVYLDPMVRGHGIGKRLYKELFEAVKGEIIHLVVAGVALPNPASVALHKHFGFREVGVFTEYAKKNGEYISSIWFEKRI